MRRNAVCHHEVRRVWDVQLKVVIAAVRKGTVSKQADATFKTDPHFCTISRSTVCRRPITPLRWYCYSVPINGRTPSI